MTADQASGCVARWMKRQTKLAPQTFRNLFTATLVIVVQEGIGEMLNTTSSTSSASVLASELEQRSLFKVKLFLFTYIAIGNFVWNLDRNNIGFAQLVIGRELAIKATLFGFAAGILALASFLMQVPAGLFFEKFGAKRWMTFTMIAWGVASMAEAFITSGTQLVVLRFVVGVFEAGFTPGIYCLITRWLKGVHYGKAGSMIFFWRRVLGHSWRSLCWLGSRQAFPRFLRLAQFVPDRRCLNGRMGTL